MILSKPKN